MSNWKDRDLLGEVNRFIGEKTATARERSRLLDKYPPTNMSLSRPHTDYGQVKRLGTQSHLRRGRKIWEES